MLLENGEEIAWFYITEIIKMHVLTYYEYLIIAGEKNLGCQILKTI